MNTMHQQSGWSAQEIYFQEQNLLPEYEFVMKKLLCFICYENKRNSQNIGVWYACMLDVAMNRLHKWKYTCTICRQIMNESWLIIESNNC